MCSGLPREAKDSECTGLPGEAKDSVCTGCIYPRKFTGSVSGSQAPNVCSDLEKGGGPSFPSTNIGTGIRTAIPTTSEVSPLPIDSKRLLKHEKDDALNKAITELAQKGAVEKVNNSNSLSYYSCRFLVPNPGKRWRPVIDPSPLNHSLLVQKFKMETKVYQGVNFANV